jgi:UDP-N-acetylglucosamine--N-acetylmuramyl-(pentapeptide) pyrophosphoryl-undecaprenol N-acetylglucosamine transferase
MESELVSRAGFKFTTIPAAGVHGVGWKTLPGNLVRLLRGYFAARSVLRQFQPEALFFTGGYVAGPVALAGSKTPTAIFVPDIEPGFALKFLSRLADRITVIAEDSRTYFTRKERVVVTGYPIRSGLDRWDPVEAYQVFGFSAEIPTLLVTGGSLGARSINQALVTALPELLKEMQVVHITGTHTWDQFKDAAAELPAKLTAGYKVYPYLHTEMGAAFSVADLIVSRAGASSLGEYPHFGIPAILVPYPHAWRYQKVNADYLTRRGAAITLEDDKLAEHLTPLILDLIRDTKRREAMQRATQSLRSENAAAQIATQLIELVHLR